MTRHILICGDVGVGKSTLIAKLLRENKRPLFGFVTKSRPADENGVRGVYIHPAGAGKRQYTADNRIGACDASGARPNPKAFETIGVALLDALPEGLVLMDELGFMESKAPVFCAKVLETLSGDIPVLAAVKSMDTPFLQAVRAHRKAGLYRITKENRDALFPQLLPVIREWNGQL